MPVNIDEWITVSVFFGDVKAHQNKTITCLVQSWDIYIVFVKQLNLAFLQCQFCTCRNFTPNQTSLETPKQSLQHKSQLFDTSFSLLIQSPKVLPPSAAVISDAKLASFTRFSSHSSFSQFVVRHSRYQSSIYIEPQTF